MEGKLIKEGNFYGLKIDDKIVGLNNDSTNKLLNYSFKLSLKNCQAIECGYDLDELASERLLTRVDENSGYHKFGVLAYKEGFQKALEILGDKKFSSRNMLKAFTTGVFTDETSDYDFEFTELMQDLQQTEWDVEIVMEIKQQLINGYKNQPDNVIGFIAEYENVVVPKLDVDGCLILKRI